MIEKVSPYLNRNSLLEDFTFLANLLIGIKLNKKKNESTVDLTANCKNIIMNIEARIQSTITSELHFPLINIFNTIPFTDYERVVAYFLIGVHSDDLLLANTLGLFPDGFTKNNIAKLFYQSGLPFLSKATYSTTFLDYFFLKDAEIHPFLINYANETVEFEDLSNAQELLIYEDKANNAIEILTHNPHILINIYGDKNCGKHYFVKYIANKINKKMITLDFETINLDKEDERYFLKNQITLFSKLESGIIYIKNLKKKDQYILSQFTDSTIFVASHEKDDLNNQKITNFIKIHLNKLTASEKIQTWDYYNKKYQVDIDAESFGNKYVFNIGDISNIFHSAQLLSNSIAEEQVLQAVKMRDGGLDGAVLIETSFTFQDLVVDDTVKRQLDHIISQLKHKNILYDQWGFDSKVPYGRGISSLFYGPPGTGKTMTAAVIANELKLDLYKVDLSKLISKYIGETEKNITSLFDNAKNMNVILFFDEADALFAKRSDVKDSNDKNANAETAHLLQKLEEYEGISILATNLFEQLDDAFKRRIKFMIPFNLPDYSVRLQLWNKILPSKEFIGDIDVDLFAKNFDLSGSQIKEIIVNASFIALSESTKLGNEHLKEAVTLNYQKYGKRLKKEDFLYLA